MRKWNEDRPIGTPEYKSPEEIQYYMNWIDLAEYRTRQWLFKKGFVPHDFEKVVRHNGGKKPPIFVDAAIEKNKDKRYGKVEYWNFEMVCTPNSDDWYDDPTRMIIYPTGKDVKNMIIHSHIRHDMRIIKRSKEFESKYRNDTTL